MTSPRRRARESALKALYQAEISKIDNTEALYEVLSETVCHAVIEAVVKDFLKSTQAQEILSGKVEEFLPDLTDNLSSYPHADINEIPSQVKSILEKHFPGITFTPDLSKDVKALCDKLKEKIEKLAPIEEFAIQLIEKTTEHISTINETIEKTATNWTLDRMANVDRCILKIAVCEFFYFPKIPVNATINEAIELAKKYSDDKSYEFINGILDKVSKEHKLDKIPNLKPLKGEKSE